MSAMAQATAAVASAPTPVARTATGVVVRTPDDLDQVRTWMTGPRETALVIDARIAADGGSWCLTEAFQGH